MKDSIDVSDILQCKKNHKKSKMTKMERKRINQETCKKKVEKKVRKEATRR